MSTEENSNIPEWLTNMTRNLQDSECTCVHKMPFCCHWKLLHRNLLNTIFAVVVQCSRCVEGKHMLGKHVRHQRNLNESVCVCTWYVWKNTLIPFVICVVVKPNNNQEYRCEWSVVSTWRDLRTAWSVSLIYGGPVRPFAVKPRTARNGTVSQGTEKLRSCIIDHYHPVCSPRDIFHVSLSHILNLCRVHNQPFRPVLLCSTLPIHALPLLTIHWRTQSTPLWHFGQNVVSE